VLAVAEFQWPCDKRIAHGPHIIELDHSTPQRVTDFVVVTEDGKGFKGPYRSCPGVRAHPDTMIGRIVIPREGAE
jgi:hypothetical protein